MQQNDVNPPEIVLLEEAVGLLRELAGWARMLGYPSLRKTLEPVLDSREKRVVYEAMDGRRGVRDIEAATKVDFRTISRWGQEWERLGIVGQSHTSKIKGRRQKLFDLALFGIRVDDGTESSEPPGSTE
ncbi:MAG TPA: hypothetical protein VMX14_05630 [Anaerolineae bacterium]|nr:hypothetical protein [Anaerolineae bacterium]HUV94296.1 hypothetical protein [Anaerolineae bacterium]